MLVRSNFPVLGAWAKL